MTDIFTPLQRRANVTIKDVAERAGVSQMTVSRVLNQSESVKPSTRDRVDAAIRELNYRPNLLARGLAGGAARFLGLIYNNPSTSYLSEILVGALKQCRELGHYLVLEEVESTLAALDTQSLVERIAAAGLDGVIVIPPLSESEDLLNGLAAEGIATVVIAPGRTPTQQPTVSINDEAAAMDMMSALFQRGHRDVAFIRGDESQSAARRRHRGYLAAMKAQGLSVHADWVVQGDFTYRSGMSAARQLLKAAQRPSVIFASNDDMAAGAVAALQAEGVRVPSDVSVVGFDDSAIASAIWPSLTTLRQPIADMAAASVRLLAETLSGVTAGRPSERCVLDVALVERESLGRI